MLFPASSRYSHKTLGLIEKLHRKITFRRLSRREHNVPNIVADAYDEIIFDAQGLANLWNEEPPLTDGTEREMDTMTASP
jgi:hypothetical protein